MFGYLIQRIAVPMTMTMLLVSSAQATTCMVMGERTAQVQTPDGHRSPVFLSNACEQLRLVSGKAIVSWVGRDGKPQMVPMGPQGVDHLPSPGAEERPASSIWAELTSKRDAQRSAYMRALGDDKATRFYVPETGLNLRVKLGSTLRLYLAQEGGDQLIAERLPSASGAVHLEKDLFSPGAVYQLDWEPQSGGEAATERWRVRPVSFAEQQSLHEKFQQVAKELPDHSQQAVMAAMVFEQLRLPLNVRLVLSAAPVRSDLGLPDTNRP